MLSDNIENSLQGQHWVVIFKVSGTNLLLRAGKLK